MYQVTWLVHGELFSTNTPDLRVAEHLVAILPRWMRPRLWRNPRKQAHLLTTY